jgi:hypothetical protein
VAIGVDFYRCHKDVAHLSMKDGGGIQAFQQGDQLGDAEPIMVTKYGNDHAKQSLVRAYR